MRRVCPGKKSHLVTGIPISQRLTAPVRSAREGVAVAEPLAGRHVQSPRAWAIQINAKPQAIVSVTVGLYALRRGLFGGIRVWHGFVIIDNDTHQAELGVGGEFSPKRFAWMEGVPAPVPPSHWTPSPS